MMKKELVVIVMVLFLIVPIGAVEVRVIPYTTPLIVNEIEISQPSVLNLTIPAKIDIRWKNGEVSGILTMNSFEINQISIENKEETKICEFIMTISRVEIQVSNLPALEFKVSTDGNYSQSYDGDLRIFVESTLPASVNITGYLGDVPYFEFSATIRPDGFPEVHRLWSMAPQTVSLKIMINNENSKVPLVLKPIILKAEKNEISSIGYELIGKPVKDNVTVLKVKVLNERGEIIQSKLVVSIDGDEMKMDVNGTAIISVPRGKEILIKAIAEGYRVSEKKVFSSLPIMEVNITLERSSIYDSLVTLVERLTSSLNPLYLILLIGLISFIALVLAVRR